MTKTILITGGAGFIGSSTAQRLANDGNEIILVDNFNQYYDPTLKEARVRDLLKDTPHTLYRSDIEDIDAMREIFQNHKIDTICHQAAQAGVRYAMEDPFAYGHTNLIGTLTLLELAKEFGIASLVMASSSSVYGNAEHYPVKETDNTDKPLSLYAATKKATELKAYAYHHLYGMHITCLRYFTVYGPWGRPDMALFKFTKNALEGKPIDVYGHGKMARDFTYIDDIVDGIARAIDLNAPWEILNLGRGQAEELMDFIGYVETHTGKTLEKNFMDVQPGDAMKTWADVSKAKEVLGWEPKVSLDAGIKKFVEWYESYYA
jgi:UDP-glucuronate 4-epimerase